LPEDPVKRVELPHQQIDSPLRKREGEFRCPGPGWVKHGRTC
jgi:hypothetical protein